MTDIRSLSTIELDALREVASIGAGHAATALSQMIGETIMITVPTINVAPLESLPPQLAEGDEPVAAVLMQMTGDLSGRTLLVFPRRTAMRLATILLARQGGGLEMNEMEQSALKEVGNILSSAYLTALSDFMSMSLLPSPPSLAVDMSDAVLSTAYLQFGTDRDVVICIESEFVMMQTSERLRGFFLLLPDERSLATILHAVHVG